MSRNFPNATDKITFGTGNIPAGPGTAAMWVYPTWVQTDLTSHIFLWKFDNSGTQVFVVTKDSLNNLAAGWFGGSGNVLTIASSNYTMVQSSWNSICFSWTDAATTATQEMWLNGASIGTFTGTNLTFQGTTNLRAIGNRTDINAPAVASMAHVALWSSYFTLDDAQAFHGGAYPPHIRPGSLVDHLPLWGVSSPEPNVVGGTEGSITGAVLGVDGPRLFVSYDRPFIEPGVTPRAAVGVAGWNWN